MPASKMPRYPPLAMQAKTVHYRPRADTENTGTWALYVCRPGLPEVDAVYEIEPSGQSEQSCQCGSIQAKWQDCAMCRRPQRWMEKLRCENTEIPTHRKRQRAAETLKFESFEL